MQAHLHVLVWKSELGLEQPFGDDFPHLFECFRHQHSPSDIENELLPE
jgi:hypothetical protein